MSKKYKRVAITELSNIEYGRSIRSGVVESKESDIALVMMRDADGIDYESLTHVELSGIKEPNFLAKNDILVLSRSSFNRALLIDSKVDEIDFKLIAAPCYFIVRADQKQIFPAYLAWWLNQAEAQEYLQSQTTGGKAKVLTRTALESLEVVLPSMKEQQEIVKTIMEVNEKTKALEQQIVEAGVVLTDIASKLNAKK